MPVYTFMDLTGQTFGRLTVITQAGMTTHGNVMWMCRCTCGTNKIIRAGNLRSGHTISCGCYRVERGYTCTRTHGMRHSPEFMVFCNMKRRCYDPTHKRFKDYGGRGIYIEWKTFEEFYADKGPRPGPEYTIERLDNDGPYSNDNTAWATRLIQGNNKRNNHLATYMERTQTIAQWCRELNVPYTTILRRLKLGYTVEHAFCQPITSSAKRLITFNKRSQCVTAWAKELGVQPQTLFKRLNAGWSIEKTLTTPIRHLPSPHRTP